MIQSKLDCFYASNQIPNIIFHGSSGTGKSTIVKQFIRKIYGDDKSKMKINVMSVNCAQGKGIKFIRDELKLFAKSNLQPDVKFKTIVLYNADSLTNDAQSALRRCIEIFSFNTRFFIVVENKHKLLNPIVSRFCEIYVPELVENGRVINLHKLGVNKPVNECVRQLLDSSAKQTHQELTKLCIAIYEHGRSCLDVVEYIQNSSAFSDSDKANIMMRFQTAKSEFRSEKLLMLYMLDFAYLHI
jgi:DNA polymerase III delta prime subunit